MLRASVSMEQCSAAASYQAHAGPWHKSVARKSPVESQGGKVPEFPNTPDINRGHNLQFAIVNPSS